MAMDLANNLQTKVCDICNKLLKDNKLITTKVVLSILSETYSDHLDNVNEESIAGIINCWRLSRIDVSKIQQISGNINSIPNFHDYSALYQKNSRYRKQLFKARREIQFLKAKMKALNSFYNRQRQEFIMRIEGMLYK